MGFHGKNEEATNEETKLKWSEKIGYGFGDFGNGFMFDLGQSYLTKYFTDIAMITPGMVGTIFAVTKIFDAFMDPLAGSFIDSRQSGKQGKFRPVMMISSIILAILTVVTFTCFTQLSHTSRVIYALITYMAWGVMYSFTNVPYGSLASVMTRDVEDRAILATTRQAGSLSAALITGSAFVPIMMVFSNGKNVSAQGYTIAAAIMAFCGVIGFLICFLTTKEHTVVYRQVKPQRESVKDYIKVVFTNKPLGALILLTLFMSSASNATGTMLIYFCQYNLGNIGLQPVVNLFMMGASVFAILTIPFLVKHFGKKQTAVVSFIIGAIASVLNFILPTNNVTFIILISIGFVCMAIPNGVTWAFVSDVIDYGEWHTGIRKEGITYAAFNFSRKIAQSLAAIVSAGVLGFTGYVANQTQSSTTLLGIKGAMTLYPAIALVLAAVILFLLYGLSDDKYRKIAVDLSNGKWEYGEISGKR